MKITDEIRKSAARNQDSGEENDKILQFPTDYAKYQAFFAPTGDPQLKLEIRAKQMFLMKPYYLLEGIAHTGVGDFIGLTFPLVQVKMFGRNLQPLVHALRDNRVEWVREYHPPYWDFEPDEDDGTLPCIEEIIIEGSPIDPEAEIRARNSG